MSILSTARYAAYTGNGSTSTYSIAALTYASASDLAVKIAGVLLTLNSDYEVVGTYPNQSIHFIYWPLGVKTDNPPANGAAITIERFTPVTQPTAFRNQGQYFAVTHEAAYDRACMIAQDMLAYLSLIQTVQAALVYDFAGFYGFLPRASQLIGKWTVVRNVTFSANYPGSKATAGYAATASTVLSIYKNGVVQGTITFGIGATVGTFVGSAFSLVPGDILMVACPASPDATLAEISVTLAGTRVP